MRKYEYPWKLIKVGEPIPTTQLKSSRDSQEYLLKEFKKLDLFREHFIIVALDRSNKTIGNKVISSGGLHGTVVDIRIVAKYLIGMLASSCIVSHNHPSGNTNPSQNDNRITKQLKDGLEILDISLLDHIIIGSQNNYYSYGDEGAMC